MFISAGSGRAVMRRACLLLVPRLVAGLAGPSVARCRPGVGGSRPCCRRTLLSPECPSRPVGHAGAAIGGVRWCPRGVARCGGARRCPASGTGRRVGARGGGGGRGGGGRGRGGSRGRGGGRRGGGPGGG